MTRFCKYCGAELSVGAAFCKGCGAAQPKIEAIQPASETPKFCMNCGEALRAGAVFCKNCGQAVGQGQPPTMRAGTVRPQQPSSAGINTGRRLTPQSRPSQQQHRRSAKPAIAAVVALAVFLSFIYPGFIRTSLFGGKGDGTGTHIAGNTGMGGMPEIQPPAEGMMYVTATDGTLVEVEDRPNCVGHSKAFSIEPIEGLRISAEENALDYDREFSARKLEDEELLDAIEQMEAEDKFLLKAFDIDAGLAPKENLPGYYDVSIDLSDLEIPEELVDYIEVIRIDDDGSRYTYVSEFDGNTVSYHSSQNSATFVVLSFTLVGLASKLIYDQATKDTQYYNDKTLMIEETAHFKVYFASEDFTNHNAPKKFVEKAEELKKLTDRILAPIKEKDGLKHDTNPNTGDLEDAMLNRIRAINRDAKEILANNPDYPRLRKELYELYPVELKRIFGYLEDARTYLGGEEQHLRLPPYKMNIYLMDSIGGGEAQTHQLLFDNPVMQVAIGNMYKGLDAVPKSMLKEERFREDRIEALLTTITHEMAHACQYEYYKAGVSEVIGPSLKLVEATACVTEVDGLHYFIAQGKLPELAKQTMEQLYSLSDAASGALTSRDLPAWYSMPLDEIDLTHGGSNIGYALAHMVDYFNDHDKPLKTADIMEKYSCGEDFSAVMMDAYGETYQEFQFLFVDFMREQRDKGIVNAAIKGGGGRLEEDHPYFGMHEFARGEASRYHEARSANQSPEFLFATDLFQKIHRFSSPDPVLNGRHSLLVVTDPDNLFNGSEYNAINNPAYPLMNLRFVEANLKLPEVSQYLLDEDANILWLEDCPKGDYWLSEICGLSSAYFRRGLIAFDAIMLFPPEKPKILPDYPQDGTVTFQFQPEVYPFYSNQSVAKRMQEYGVCVKMPGETDPAKIQYFPTSPSERMDDLGKDASLPKKDCKLDLSDTTRYVSCAYFKLYDKYYYGPENEASEDIFGVYDIEVTTKEYSSALDSLVASMPNSSEFTDYKNLYANESQKMIGVPQKATLVVTDLGAAYAGGEISDSGGSGIDDPLGLASGFYQDLGVAPPSDQQVVTDLGLNSEEIAFGKTVGVSLIYQNQFSSDGTIDITQAYSGASSVAFHFKGMLRPDQRFKQGDSKKGQNPQNSYLTLTLDYDAGDSFGNSGYDFSYTGLFAGPLTLEFMQDPNGKFHVTGESKTGYGEENKNLKEHPELAMLNLKYWFTLAGDKTNRSVDGNGSPSGSSAGNGSGGGYIDINNGWEEAPPVGYDFATPYGYEEAPPLN